MNKKLTYEVCYQAAKECKTLKEFREKYASELTKAYNTGWVKDYTWLEKRRGDWTFEEIEELAKDCTTLSEFRVKHPDAYMAVQKMHRSKDLKLDRHSPHTYEEIKEVALKYEYLKDFRKDYTKLYNYALRRNWIESFEWLKKSPVPYKDDVDCCYMYINEEHKIVYVGRTYRQKERHIEHKCKKNAAGSKFKKYGLELPEPIYYINNAKFNIEYGLMIEDKLVQWFKENGWTVLNKAKTGVKSGSVGRCNKKWNKTSIEKAASECQTLKEFAEKYPSAYAVVKENNIELNLERLKRTKNFWSDKEHCREAALQCSGVKDFSRKFGGAYNVSRDNGWISEFFESAHKGVNMLSLDGKFIKYFKSQKEACDYLGIKRGSIAHCCNGNKKTAYGYRWEYAIKK